MDPYRSPLVEHAEAPRDPGIVGDVIAQFADATAFLRELVQNAIDAGSPSVDVRFEVDGEVARVSVKDRGEGMTREIVEDQLLVLFRSTKEQDRSKIGKFGIGFASVLAPDPEVVAIHTARDGRRLTVHLYRDLTYQLFDAGPATQTGTTVEVELRLPDGGAEPLARDCRTALLKWCRHASVPIHFTHASVSERIDRPLSFDDAVVEVTRSDGELTCVVAIGPAAPYVGFFNHGLTLYETSEPLLGKLAVKLQDPQLGHTLSRDNVRRDERFAHALAFARQVATRDLPLAAATALRTAAESDRDRYRVLVAEPRTPRRRRATPPRRGCSRCSSPSTARPRSPPPRYRGARGPPPPAPSLPPPRLRRPQSLPAGPGDRRRRSGRSRTSPSPTSPTSLTLDRRARAGRRAGRARVARVAAAPAAAKLAPSAATRGRRGGAHSGALAIAGRSAGGAVRRRSRRGHAEPVRAPAPAAARDLPGAPARPRRRAARQPAPRRQPPRARDPAPLQAARRRPVRRPARVGVGAPTMRRAAPGPQLGAGRIRVDAARAIAKLREYQLADRTAWVLEAIRAAVASGATAIELTGDANDVRLTWTGAPWPADDLPRLLDEPRQPRGDERAPPRAHARRRRHVNSALGLSPAYARRRRRDRRADGAVRHPVHA